MAMLIKKRVQDLSSRMEGFQSRLPKRKELDKFDKDLSDARAKLRELVKKLDKSFQSYELTYAFMTDSKVKQQQALSNEIESRQTKICF